jgi:hypothetical protein
MNRFLTVIILFQSLVSLSQQQYVNGNLSTGSISRSGVMAPTGYTWAELQSNLGEPSITNDQNGYEIYYGANYENLFADDFVVPSGQTWSIHNFEFFVYGVQVSFMPVTQLGMEIWNGDPSLATSTKLYGDITVDTFDATNSGEAFMYIIRNTSYNPGGIGSSQTNLESKVWKIRGNLNVTLNPGTYWILFQPRYNIHTSTSPVAMVPLNRYPNSRGYPTNSPARFFANWPGSPYWIYINDQGMPSNIAQDLLQDFHFKINYSLSLNNDTFTKNTFNMYPNPTKDLLTIQANESTTEIPQIAVFYDIRGLKVYESKINSLTTNNFTLDVSSLNKGVYLMKLLNADGVIYTDKVIKE